MVHTRNLRSKRWISRLSRRSARCAMCNTPIVVVLIAGGLRVLKTQHVDGRAEGVPALARLGGVTAGRGGYGGAWGCWRSPARARARAPRGGTPLPCASRAVACTCRTHRARRRPRRAVPTAAPRACRAPCWRAHRAHCAARGGRGSAKGAAAGDQRAEGGRGLGVRCGLPTRTRTRTRTLTRS